MAQGGSVLDLIWAVCLESDGQGGLGCWAAALNAGVGFAAAGLPEMAIPALQGAIWVAVWCNRMRATCVVH